MVNEQEKILDFLKQIADQLGPAGERAFRIVAERVYAEALIWVVFGIATLILSIILTIVLLIIFSKSEGSYGEKHDYGWLFIAGCTLITGLGISAVTIVPNAMNMASIEYATIARILNLVGGN